MRSEVRVLYRPPRPCSAAPDEFGRRFALQRLGTVRSMGRLHYIDNLSLDGFIDPAPGGQNGIERRGVERRFDNGAVYVRHRVKP